MMSLLTYSSGAARSILYLPENINERVPVKHTTCSHSYKMIASLDDVHCQFINICRVVFIGLLEALFKCRKTSMIVLPRHKLPLLRI